MSRWVFVAVFLLVSSSAAAAAADEGDPGSSQGKTAWVLGSAGFGFGGGALGALYAAAGGEAHVWLANDIGVGARYAAFAAGAPDGGGAEGNAVAGLVSYRAALGRVQDTPNTQSWFVATLGVGDAHVYGYTGTHKGDGDFDFRAVVVTPRLALLTSWHFLTIGGAVEGAVIPGHGGAGAMSLVGGAVF